MARPPKMPNRGDIEADVYAPKAPGEKIMEYDDPNNPMMGPELPGVAPPSGTHTIPAPQPQGYGQPPPETPRRAPPPQAAPAGPVLSPGPVLPPPPPPDPSAVNILQLVQGGRFKQPFTVTLMRKTGVALLRTSAGTKQEDEYKVCQITIREPSDLMTTAAAIGSGSLKPLNSNTLEFQLMLYLAHQGGLLIAPPPPPMPVAPPPPPPAPVAQQPLGLPPGFVAPPGFTLVQTAGGFSLVPTPQPQAGWQPDPNGQQPQ